MKMYAVKFTRDELDNLADVCRDYANYIINESGVLKSTILKLVYYSARCLKLDTSTPPLI